MIINWPELEDSLDPFERWVGGLILAAITDGKLFEKKGWVLRKNSTKLNVVLTIEGEEVLLLPFLKRIYDDLDRQIQIGVESLKEKVNDIHDFLYETEESIKLILHKRFPRLADPDYD